MQEKKQTWQHICWRRPLQTSAKKIWMEEYYAFLRDIVIAENEASMDLAFIFY
jgi:hypothetical protein